MPAQPTARLLVIQHEDDCPPAWFGEWFSEAGVAYDVVLGHRGEPVPADLDGYDGLVVLGGEMGANDDAEHAWLAPTKALISTVVAQGHCFLGICLGHQLASAALGGEVIVNPLGQAVGLTPVGLNTAGEADELMKVVDGGALSIQWNRDVTSRLPDGAVVLATSPDGTVQAARFAERAWGVQFHPEASPAVFASWINAVSADGAGAGRLEQILREITDAEAQLRRSWAPLARRFAEIVSAQSSAVRRAES
jgi:GMP synthase (glutamine-hydrolysing)